MVQRYNILGRYTNQYLCLCSRAWSVEVSHGKIRVRRLFYSCPKLLFSCFFHFALAFRTGLAIPYSDVFAAALQAQTAHLASVGWSHVGNDTTHHDVLDGMAVWAEHGCNLLTEQATSLIHLSFISTGLAAIFQFPGHLISLIND